MSEKELEKKQIFKIKSGAELSEKMIAYFKKYTIPEMKEAEKNNPRPKPIDPLKIFDGALFMPADSRH